MKTRKEQIYDFLELHLSESNGGVSTQYLADMLGIQRTSVSALLNELIAEGRVRKTNGRPVLYAAEGQSGQGSRCFENLVGFAGSLKRAVQLAQAAILYPKKSLNTLIYGPVGTGKHFHAMLMHAFAMESEVLPPKAPLMTFDMGAFASDERSAMKNLFGEGDTGGIYHEARDGVLVLEHAHLAPSMARKAVASYIAEQAAADEANDTRNSPIVIVLCEENQGAVKDFENRLPVSIEMTPLKARPLAERKELIQGFLTLEAARVGKVITVSAELMRCLLLYDCELNIAQLKYDIKRGCALAYVREHNPKNRELNLYVGDFENYVRKGFLYYKARRSEVERIIPSDYDYRFSEHTMEMTAIDRGKASERSDYPLYAMIDMRAQELEVLGIPQHDAKLLLAAEIEGLVSKYQLQLAGQVVSSEQLSRLVDERVITMTKAFLEEASSKLLVTYPSSVFYGLCLHIDALVKGRSGGKMMDMSQVKEIADKHQAEYVLCTQLGSRIEEYFGLKLTVDEIVLLTVFLCYRAPSADTAPKPVLLYALHGQGLAAALAAAINTTVRMDNTFAAEIPFEGDYAQLYPALKTQVEQIERGGGVLVLYDMDFLAGIYSTIGNETGIPIRTLQMPITTVGFEFSRRAAAQGDIDTLHRDFLTNVSGFISSKKPVILTLCSTGQGGAMQLKHYVEQHGNVEEFEVIPLAIQDDDRLKAEMAAILNDTVIHCVVGSHDPKLYNIPFISISEVFSTEPARLPDLLHLRRQTKEKQRSQMDDEAVYAYLDEHLEHVEIAKLKALLPAAIGQINSEMSALSFDTDLGLLVHLACAINRLLAGEDTPAVLRREQVIARNRDAYRTLRGIMKPLERAFKIIFNDDELAAILIIVYKI